MSKKVFIALLFVFFSCVCYGQTEFTVTDGLLNIHWDSPLDTGNLWGYRLDLSTGTECLFSQYYEGITPPAEVKLRVDATCDISISVYSVGFGSELGGRVNGIIHFILPDIDPPVGLGVQ